MGIEGLGIGLFEELVAVLSVVDNNFSGRELLPFGNTVLLFQGRTKAIPDNISSAVCAIFAMCGIMVQLLPHIFVLHLQFDWFRCLFLCQFRCLFSVWDESQQIGYLSRYGRACCRTHTAFQTNMVLTDFLT